MGSSGFTVGGDRTPDSLCTLLSARAALQEIREAKDIFVDFSQRKPRLTIFMRPQQL
jgi:hypothetical protein